MFRPRTPREIRAHLEELGYHDPWHYHRLVESALLPPEAQPESRLVDLGADPIVLHVLSQVRGYRGAEGVDSRDDRPASWSVDLPAWKSGEPLAYRLHNADLQSDRLPFEDGSVDVVTCFETLEHLLDPMHLLIEANRILEEGGLLILSTPNAVSWQSSLRAARHDHPLVYPKLRPGRDTNRHNIEYTPTMVRAMMRAAGFLGEVATRSWWYRVGWLQKSRLVLGGFRPGDRGDAIVARVRKNGPARTRFPEEVYLLTETQRARNSSTALTYRTDGSGESPLS